MDFPKDEGAPSYCLICLFIGTRDRARHLALTRQALMLPSYIPGLPLTVLAGCVDAEWNGKLGQRTKLSL